MSDIAERSTGAVPPPDDSAEPPAQPPYEPPEDDEQPDLDDALEGDDLDDEPSDRPRGGVAEEIIEPKIDPVERKLWSVNPDGGRRQERTYIQKPFEHFQMLEFYGVLGRALKIVLDDQSDAGIDDLMQMFQPKTLVDQMMQRLPGYHDAPDRSDNPVDIDQAMRVLSAFTNIVTASPDIVKEAYLVILNIPQSHRNWAMEWAFPNISQDEGEDIMATLIDQNYEVVERFFFRRLPRLAQRAAKARERHASSTGR